MSVLRRTVDDSVPDVVGSAGSPRNRGGRVRFSILSRELLLLLILAGMIVIGAGLFGRGRGDDQDRSRGFQAHETLVESTRFSADGQTLFTCGWDKRIKVWDVRSKEPPLRRELLAIEHEWHVFDVAITPNDSILASGGAGGLLVWEPDGRGGWTLVAEERGVSRRCVAASPDGRLVASGGGDGSVRLWDVASRKETPVLGGVSDEPRAIAFSRDGGLLAVVTFGGQFRIWDLKARGGPSILPTSLDSVQCFAFTGDDETIAVARGGDEGRGLVLWNYRKGTPVLRLSDHAAETTALAISEDGSTLAAAGKDRTVRLWDLQTGLLRQSFPHDAGWIQTVSFSRDGRQLAFGGKSGFLYFRTLDERGRFVETPAAASAAGGDGLS
ncbi:WD40 repeat domain-containing protein [Aquisphaera insulae]|uniref:WD40 repeat domain-containing protein n=1 Tax=Aquisphaera insulae TaxID=2712864 RepID=UPI0013EC0A32|nr:WD40 repeat domain-containing protein [Aquisphaera insulae]